MSGKWHPLALMLICLAACAPRVEGYGPQRMTASLGANTFTMTDGYQLPALVTLPETAPKAALIALHGFNDYSNAFADQSQTWAAAGIAVYAFDQRGFGRTDGRGLWHGAEAMVQDLATVADLLRQKHPGIPLAVIGESMGGAVALASLTDASLARPDVDRVILSAPAVWGRAVMPWWQRWPLAVFAHTLPWLEIAPPIRRTPSDNTEMLRALWRDKWYIRRTRIDAIHGLVDLMGRAYAGVPKLGQDVLILLGKNEDILPEAAWKGGASRLTPGTGWRLAVYDSGYHLLTRDLNAAQVIGDITSFVLNPTDPLPSGKEVTSQDLPTVVN